MNAVTPQNQKDRSDLSQFLIHLTKDGSFERFDPKPGPPAGYEKVRVPVVAKTSLIDILQNKRIEARSPFGYFKLKINMFRALRNRVFVNGNVDPSWIHSVCFSEAPISELGDFYRATTNKRNQYKKYGVAFLQERLRQLGGNPIFYVDSRRQDLLNALNSSLLNNGTHFLPMMHLIDTFGPPVVAGAAINSDFRWEREWRKKDSLFFTYADLAFGICPADEIPYFKNLTSNQVTFIDPDWDKTTLKAYLQANAPGLLAHF